MLSQLFYKGGYSPLKILFYINAIHHGGAERVMVNLADYFCNDDMNECLLVTSFQDEWEYPVNNKVRRIVLCEQMPSSFIKRNLLLVKKLRNVIIQEKPDVVLSFMAEPNFRNIIASVGLSVKKIISIRNDPAREYPNMLFKIAAKVLYPLADGVVFQTEDAQKWFSKKIRNKSCVIFNPVDSIFFTTTFDGTRKNIVTTGRLTRQKNHKMLIDAFSMIANLVSDNLIIYGEGEMREELEKRVADLELTERIFLPGAVTDVANTIKSAKLFVLSSDYEGMPNSLMEAMALGIPCISTDCPCGGPRALISNMENGVLVPIGDIQQIANSILLILENAEKSESISSLARISAQNYHPDKIYKQWKEYFCCVLYR